MSHVTTPAPIRPRLAEKPIFIVGHPRSGTTLLRFMLSSHPRIHIPPETGFLPHVFRYDGRRLSRDDVRRLIQQIERLNHEWHGVVNDHDAFFEVLPEPTLSYVLDALYRKRMEESGAARWGDKTPIYVRYIRQIDRVFPDAQFIHIIRDGRDAALSALRKWKARYWYLDTYYLMKNWVRNVTAGQRASEWLGPGRYLEVRYEEIVQNTPASLKRICEFLGEQFDAAMLDQAKLARDPDAECHHAEVTKPISQASVYRWKKEMSDFDRKLANHLAGPLLRGLRYNLDEVRAGPRDRLSYVFLGMRFATLDLLRLLIHRLGIRKMTGEKYQRRLAKR